MKQDYLHSGDSKDGGIDLFISSTALKLGRFIFILKKIL